MLGSEIIVEGLKARILLLSPRRKKVLKSLHTKFPAAFETMETRKASNEQREDGEKNVSGLQTVPHSRFLTKEKEEFSLFFTL